MDKIEPYADLGEKLKALRGDIPISEFAEKLGIKVRTYYRYEKGERPIKKGLLRLAEIESSASKSRVQQPVTEYEPHGGWKPDPEKASGFSGESQEWNAMGQLYQLLKDGDDTLKRAIIANLTAFTSAMDTKEANRKLAAQVDSLTERLTTMEQQLQRQGLVVVDRRSGDDRRENDQPYTGEERRVGGDRRKQSPGT